MGQSYRDLIAWQKAMDYVMDIYKARLLSRDGGEGVGVERGGDVFFSPPQFSGGATPSRPLRLRRRLVESRNSDRHRAES